MKHLFFKSDGTITLFCALIMSSLILFFMVLIDFCRLLLFERNAESAVRLAAQSVISAYDKQLYDDYGLFARGGTESEAIFREAIRFNLGNTLSLFSEQQGVDFAASKLEDVTIYANQFIGQHDVFKGQVLDVMKYRAPIDFTVELIDQWSPLKDGVEKATAMISVLEELSNLYEQREQLLEEAYHMQTQLGQSVSGSIVSQISAQADSTIRRYSSYISWVKAREKLIDSINELELRLMREDHILTDEEKDNINDRIDELWRDVEDYDSSIQSYKSTATKFVKGITQQTNDIDEKLLQYKGSYLKINKAFAINNTMKIKYELHLQSISSTSASEQSELGSEIDQMMFDQSMIRDVNELQAYRAEAEMLDLEVERIAGSMNAFAAKINSLTSMPNISANGETIKAEALQQSDSLKQQINDFVARYDEATGSIMLQWGALINEQHSIKKELKQYDQQFDAATNELETLKNMLNAEFNIDAIHKQYDELELRFTEIERHNQNRTPTTIGIDPPTGNGRKQGKAATSQLTNLFDLFNDGLLSMRDSIYVNEYALSRFSSFPYDEIKLEEVSNLEPWLDISKQEVEYIIYGFHEPLVNAAAAFGEIFTIRFAIRTIEGLIANRALTHPLAILAAAVVHGIRYAIDDMKELIHEGATKLSKYVPIDVTYRQYLRLILLLHHSGQQSRLSRMLALIENNTGYSTLKLPTSITAEAKISMHLWAVPGIAEFANRVSGGSSEVDGNVYKKTKLVTASY